MAHWGSVMGASAAASAGAGAGSVSSVASRVARDSARKRNMKALAAGSAELQPGSREAPRGKV